MPRDAGLAGTNFQHIAQGVGGAGGADGSRCTRIVSGDEGGREGGGEESSGDDSSSDGIGELANVADITDCLEVIGEVSKKPQMSKLCGRSHSLRLA